MGELWSTSPLKLLETSDFEWAVLLACAKVIQDDREEQERARERTPRR
ncbi:uncharacterized protein METZ01_LOCUS453105 [marine metagenome]|uniref:Uncharacterized protein n=1 Tax=marine metagenome TaxID=408172 RepID=A0A382ZXS2_9ZZZZ